MRVLRLSGLLLRFLVLSIVYLPRKSSQRHALCVKFCGDIAEDEWEYGKDQFTVPCVGVADDKCSTGTGLCEKQCGGECVSGYLFCPRAAAPSPPPPPPPATTDPACLKHCVDPKLLHKRNPFHGEIYNILCEKPPTRPPPGGDCGSLCPGCSGNAANPSCSTNGHLTCPALQDTVFPEICRQHCAKEAWRINKKKTDGRFNAYCGSLDGSAQENDCGAECPAECKGWCTNKKMGGMLRCPAVDPQQPGTTNATTGTNTTTAITTTTMTPGNTTEPGEVKEKDMLITYVAIGGVVVAVLLGLLLAITWFMKTQTGAPVAPAPSNHTSSVVVG